MKIVYRSAMIAACAALIFVAASHIRSARVDAAAQNGNPSVFTDFHGETPGHIHHITAADLPQPYATKSAAVFSRPVPRPADVWPQAPAGFKVQLYSTDLKAPRIIVKAPNGDLFVSETNSGQIMVLRGMTADGKAEQTSEFASSLRLPFGIAFYPRGKDPKYVYVGDTNEVVRFPYQNGDMKARGPKEVVVPNLPAGPNHFARGVAFSLDDKQMFISVGSHSNVPPATDPDPDPLEFHRADILVATPDGADLKVYASGIRNGSGLTVNPKTGEVWTSVNERDEIGDNLPPDYVTHVQEGGFYGWPWYYTGDHQDPRFPGKHPELADKVLVPDVLLEPHDASLGLTFYYGKQFPKEYRGQLFVAEHGSWNRSIRTGYEVIMAFMKDGHATGAYEDFLTGFVLPDGNCWGRPVGVAVAEDGSLIVTDDGSNSVWRVSHQK